MKQILSSRRNFIKISLTTTGSLSLGLTLPGCQSIHKSTLQSDGDWTTNAWLEITADNRLIFTLDRVEMGQGTYTGLTTLVAEELDTDPALFEVVFAPAKTIYRNRDYGLQLTGGSNSLSTSWQILRETGGLARFMLISAASEVLNTPRQHLILKDKFVIDPHSQKKISFGELASIAAKQAQPDTIPLKDKSQFLFIGKPSKRLDSALKVSGQAGYGIDVDIEGMRYAVVTRAPRYGEKALSSNGESLIGKNGVETVVEIRSGIAIVAASYWQARKAQKLLQVEWSNAREAILNSDEIFEFYAKQAEQDRGDSKRSEGDSDEALESAIDIVSEDFKTPFLAHATMEPMNCTAHIQKHKADIWTCTQAPDVAAVAVAKATDIDLANVHIHNQFLGGGFGRRLSQDFVAEAAEISAKAGGVIKLVWSREEDTQHDFYRPATLHKIRVGLNKDKQPVAWDHQIVAPNIMDWYIWDASPAMFPWSPKFMYSTLGKVGLLTSGTPITPADTSAYEGADDIPYAFPNLEVRHTKADAGIPVSYWRSVGHSHTAFAIESMMSELAVKVEMDEVSFRESLLADSPRTLNVLREAAKLGQWGRPLPKNVHQGIAVHKSFGSYVAELVELSVIDKEIRLLKVCCVIDCGLVVNPDIVRMQMESCIIFGATAALYGEITFKDGLVQQSNFDDYPIMRMNQSPDIDVHIIASDEPSTGVGEPGLPPLAPAIASALYKATNQRYRTMPFKIS